MSKTQWVGRILVAVIVAGLLIATGFAIYRIGYTRGTMIARTGEDFQPRFLDRFGFPQDKLDDGPMWPWGRSGFLQPDLDRRLVPLSRFLGVRSFFSPIALILKVVFVAVILWVLYKFVILITRGKEWQLTLRSQPASTATDVEPADEREG